MVAATTMMVAAATMTASTGGDGCNGGIDDVFGDQDCGYMCPERTRT